MPLEELVDLGYQVSRPPDDMILPPIGATVWGYDRQWVVQPGQDEEEVVTEAKNHKKLYDKMTQALEYFSNNYANWATMTNAQKDAANRQAQRGLANLIRHVRGDLSSEGI
jgi:hypothetical protein